MSAPVPLNLLNRLTTETVKHLARLYEVTRTDGVVLRFTDTDRLIIFEGEEFTPVGGVQTSALQHKGGLKERNSEIVGVLSSDSITFDDLRAGRYNDARIREYFIDARYPFAGALFFVDFWVVETVWSGEQWNVQISTLPTKLRREVGDVYGKTCRYDLGDSRCQVDLNLMTLTSKQVTSVNDPRLEFELNVTDVLDVTGSSAPDEDGWFNHGKITWTSGNNVGLVSEILDWNSVTKIAILNLKLPDDVQTGDQLDISPGCDKLLSTCRDKFNNVELHGGFPTIPGTDAMMDTPDAK